MDENNFEEEKMDKHIIAIGGGGFGRNPGNGIIEQYILDQSNSKKPNICFIPTATGDDESYKVSYYATLSKLNCNPTHFDPACNDVNAPPHHEFSKVIWMS